MGAREEAIAAEFMGAFANGWPDDFEEPAGLFAADGYYQMNVPTTEIVRGRDAIREALENMRDNRCSGMRIDMLAMASTDRFVFQERIDHAEINGKWIHTPLVAVYEIEDGLIVAWREYFDSFAAARSFGVSNEEYYSLDETSPFGRNAAS